MKIKTYFANRLILADIDVSEFCGKLDHLAIVPDDVLLSSLVALVTTRKESGAGNEDMWAVLDTHIERVNGYREHYSDAQLIRKTIKGEINERN